MTRSNGTQAGSERRRRAFSLVELSIVLGIVGIVTAGIWYAASSVKESQKIVRNAEFVLEGSLNLRKLLDTAMVTGSWVGLSATFLLNSGVFPGAVYDGTSVLKTPYGNKISAGINGSGVNAYIQVSVSADSVAECLKTVSFITSRYTDRYELRGLSIGRWGVGPWISYSSWPMSPTGSYCSGVTPPIEMAFMFTFPL